ncbi:ATP phosphoribosyltransferase regulatory subunit [Methylocystis suflitae]|uniref:ATP phosphoribosyltransferase regulatory subunit n=1 Tax=Methylocystis suflitae TaxID=2951405 RepID=UPI00210B5C46|nr:ATP phosphoribosyltransferase regulatory subunit [Methylocystis suflitae]MCQ4191307.1 ATP phosphoribosyltransferase regulatory subunit [Methylocystis suflitae]
MRLNAVTATSAEREATSLAAILAHFAREGFARCEPRLLQPAHVFLDRSGEDFRGRLYLTSDGSGAEFCLRPEYTIPVCLDYLASARAGDPAAYAYGGSIFRAPEHGATGDGEFLQAGLESFGRQDREAADVEILAASLEAAAAAGATALRVLIGDAGLVAAFLERLEMPPVWRRRLAAGHARGQRISDIFASPERNGGSEQSGVLAALTKVDPSDARRLVEDLLSIAGITAVGGRSAAEIAERFLDQATLAEGAGVSNETRALAETFFTIEGAPESASAAMRRLAADAQLDLSAALDAFDARAEAIAARGLAVHEIRFSASFARHLDYYTGFVFEARHSSEGEPVIGGGRYDRLLKTLGAASDIPAVGAAIWIDRLSPSAGEA